MMQTEWRPESLVITAELAEHARRRGITPGQFALAWVLNNRIVTSPIAGPRTEEQWRTISAPSPTTSPRRTRRW